MPSLHDAYDQIRHRLNIPRSEAPPQQGELAPFAAILRAWLQQVLDPLKAASAGDALHNAGLSEPASLAEAHPSEIVETLRSIGAKLTPKSVATLQKLARWTHDRGEDSLRDAPTPALRDELVVINGVGPGTADALLLHGLDRPVYPLDRPSYRIFARHGWVEPESGYDEAKDVFERLEPDNPAGLRQLAAQLGAIAARYCRAGKPRCENCPLKPYLPEGGPLSGDE